MENYDERNELEKIDITAYALNFLKTIRKFWLIMLIGTMILGGIYFIYSRVSYTPMYQSQITFTVNTANSNADFGSVGASEQIRESLPYILNSKYMKNLVMEDLEMDYFPASISFESKEFVEFYVMKVTASDANLSYDILNSVVENCPKASVYVLGQITLNILDSSGLPTTTINYTSNSVSAVTGILLGFMISMIFAFIYTLTNRTIGNEDELKKYLSVNCLANLPAVTFKKRRKVIDKHIHIYNSRIGYAYLENIRIMRVRVERSMIQMGAKTVMVTSSIPKEGKSTVAANLALSLAEKSKKVALVDLDLRNPSVYDVLGIKRMDNISGIFEYLKDGKKVSVRYEEKWNLCILDAGEQQNNPVEYLRRRALADLIEDIKEEYDYVVMDTPPAAMLSDAAIIAKHVDSAVYVVKQDYARIERVTEGMENLSLAQIPVIGIVLNHVENVIGGYGSYRYGNYGAYHHFSEKEDVYSENDDSNEEYVPLDNPWEKEQ